LINSPKVATYDLKPEMSAYEVTDKVLECINKKEYDVIILNYANPDMVGHTGVFEAAKAAIEAIDECLGKVVPAVLEQNGVVLITADHGNSEQMIDYETGDLSRHIQQILFLSLSLALEMSSSEKKACGPCADNA